MDNLDSIIWWDNFRSRGALDSLRQYTDSLFLAYGDLLDLSTIDPKQDGPPLRKFPSDIVTVITKELQRNNDVNERLELYLRLVKLLCILIRNNNNRDALGLSSLHSSLFLLVRHCVERLLRENQEDVNQWLMLLSFILYFLECLYDPDFRWRRFRQRINQDVDRALEPSLFDEKRALPVSQDVIPWIYDTLKEVDCDRDLKLRTMHLFCAIALGSEENARIVITPATMDALNLSKDRSVETVVCMSCIVKALSDLPKEERQVDLDVVIAPMISICLSKEVLKLTEMRCIRCLLVGRKEVVSQMLQNRLVQVFRACMSKLCEVNWPLTFLCLSEVSSGPCREKFRLCNGYEEIYEGLISSTETVDSKLIFHFFQWAVGLRAFSDERTSLTQRYPATGAFLSNGRELHHIKDGHVVNILIRWACRMPAESRELALSILTAIDNLLRQSRHSLTECCDGRCISAVVACIEHLSSPDHEVDVTQHETEPDADGDTAVTMRRPRASSNSGVEESPLIGRLFELLVRLGGHSLAPSDLRALLRLFQTSATLKFGKRLLQALTGMVRQSMCRADEDTGMAYQLPTHWFEMDNRDAGLVLPSVGLRSSAYGFTFHAWICLDKLSRSEQSASYHRRQLFRCVTENGNGFEAFFTLDRDLMVASALAGECHSTVVTATQHRMKDSRWYHLVVVFANSRRLMTRASVRVYLNGKEVFTGDTKYPKFQKDFLLAHVGSVPASVEKAHLQLMQDVIRPRRRATLFRSGPGAGTVNSAVYLGDAHEHWGHIHSIRGQLCSAAVFNEALTASEVAAIYTRGLNNLTYIQNDDALNAKLLFYYHAKACSQDLAIDLGPHGHTANLRTRRLQVFRFHDTINQIGGLSALIPILEQVEIIDQGAPLLCKEAARLSMTDAASIDSDPQEQDFVFVPTQTSDERLTNSGGVAGFLILIRNLLDGCEANQEHLLRTQGVGTIGVLMQKMDASLIDTHVVDALQFLMDAVKEELREQIYRFILMDWRIWYRCEHAVRASHIQYVSSAVHRSPAFFRKHFGVRFLLDSIRLYHSPTTDFDPFSSDKCTQLRASLFSIVKYFLRRHVSHADLKEVFNFILSCQEEGLIIEAIDLLIQLFDHAGRGEQIVLLIYENDMADSVYALFDRRVINLSVEGQERIIQLLHTLIMSDKVADRYKSRLLMEHCGFSGFFFYLRDVQFTFLMLQCMMDILRKVAYRDLASTTDLMAYLSLSPGWHKVYAVEALHKLLVASASVPRTIANQQGWQEILVHLFIVRRRGADLVDALPRSSTLILSGTPVPAVSESCPDLSASLSASAFAAVMAGGRSVASTPNAEERRATWRRAVRAGGSSEEREVAARRSEEEAEEEEDRLCKGLVRCLRLLMWKGIDGHSVDSWRSRHEVFASLRDINERYELVRPYFYLKQRILLEMVLWCNEDVQSNEQLRSGHTENARHLIAMVFDTMVTWSEERAKCPETDPLAHNYDIALLEAVIHLLTNLRVWDEQLLWHEMCALAIHMLLMWIDDPSTEICSFACCHLHSVVQTLVSNHDEACYIVEHLSGSLGRAENSDRYSFIAPVMKTVLFRNLDILQANRHLPGLPRDPVSFFDRFRSYRTGLEWMAFIRGPVSSAAEVYANNHIAEFRKEQSMMRAEANSNMMMRRHNRNVETGRSKVAFMSRYLDPARQVIEEEHLRVRSYRAWLSSQQTAAMRQWRSIKQFLTSERGAWHDPDCVPRNWKLSMKENFLRMRPKMEPNYNFDLHTEASRLRDNIGGDLPPSSCRARSEVDETLNQESVSSDIQGSIVLLDLTEAEDEAALSRITSVSADVRRDFTQIGDDQLGDDDWMNINAADIAAAGAQPGSSGAASPAAAGAGKEGSVHLSVPAELITLVDSMRGRVELTSSHLLFTEAETGSREAAIEAAKRDLKINLNQLREIHFRRYNLRRSALEIFLIDQTNYFFNFDIETRNRVFTKILNLRPPNLLVYSRTRSPAELLKASGLTEKWVKREISNFEYLMQLNTIAGRTFNDLSQYPVFPWILSDYTSEQLDLEDESVYRDLTKPIGVVNPKNIPEVQKKYENFEDPSGVIDKFHYGTHYSNSAGVIHYMVRMEPFTALHIQLQSGKFDVADRQFHSLPAAWQGLMDNPNDNKELIPEFFYCPDFLRNSNRFDLGVLQGTDRIRVDNVELPAWATSPEDFIRKHRAALESDHVSAKLHHWIDLIFGYKQKGPAAVEALNVFYYCTYEGAVDLDSLDPDSGDKEALEGMIKHFGQTPCQLLRTPHPERMSREDAAQATERPDRPPVVFTVMDQLRYRCAEVATKDDPVEFVCVPPNQSRSLLTPNAAHMMVTITSKGLIGQHSWLPHDKTGTNGFYFDQDPSTLPGSRSKPARIPFLMPGLDVSHHLFAVTADGRWLYSGGYWDNSLVSVSLSRGGSVAVVGGAVSGSGLRVESRRVAHSDIITCLMLDAGQGHLMSGSRDTTCVVWELSGGDGWPMQWLYGHSSAVSCVALSMELDLAVSGGGDGTVNLHTVHKGQFMHTVRPQPPMTSLSTSVGVEHLVVNEVGSVFVHAQCLASGKNFISAFSINGRRLEHSERWLTSRVNAMNLAGHHLVCACQSGDLLLLDVDKDLEDARSPLPFSQSITDVHVVAGQSHILLTLNDGKLIIVNALRS